MSFIFTSIPSLTRPLTFDSDCESFFGQLPAYQINIEALAAQCEANATTLLSMSEIRSEIGDDDLLFSADDKGFWFYGGARIWKAAGAGLCLKPHSDAFPVTFRDASDSADVFIAKPPSDTEALEGTIPNKPITPANLKYVLERSGAILQVVSEGSVGASSTTSTSWQTKSTPAPSITLKKANSNVRVEVSLLAGNSSSSYTTIIDVRREISGGANTNAIGVGLYSGSAGGAGVRGMLNSSLASAAFHLLDEPGVSAGTTITYKINYKTTHASGTAYVGATDVPAIITLTEIAV